MNKEYWIAYREEIPCGVFENRQKAVSWLKKILKQTLKDFNLQDKNDEYDYLIEIKKFIIRPIKYRETYLGL